MDTKINQNTVPAQISPMTIPQMSMHNFNSDLKDDESPESLQMENTTDNNSENSKHNPSSLPIKDESKINPNENMLRIVRHGDDKLNPHKRNRKFIMEWEKRHPWVIYDYERKLMFCRWCIAGNKINSFTRGTPRFMRCTLKKHEKSNDHRRVAQAEVQTNVFIKEEWADIGQALQRILIAAKKNVNDIKFEALCNILEETGCILVNNENELPNTRAEKTSKMLMDDITREAIMPTGNGIIKGEKKIDHQNVITEKNIDIFYNLTKSNN